MPILLLVLLSVSEMVSAKKVPSTRTLVKTVTKTVSPKTTDAPPKIDRQQPLPQQNPSPVQSPLVVNELLPHPPDLFRMVRQQDLEGVRKLLADELVDINTRNAQGDSALHIASSLGDFDMVRLLIDHGAEVMLRDNLRRTVSQRADQHPELKKFLQEKVAENCRDQTQRKRSAPERKKELEIIAEQEAKQHEKMKKLGTNTLVIRGTPGWYGYGHYLKYGFPDRYCRKNNPQK